MTKKKGKAKRTSNKMPVMKPRARSKHKELMKLAGYEKNKLDREELVK
jgi:hypothetical protein